MFTGLQYIAFINICQFYQPFLRSIAVTDHYYNASVCRLTLESHDQPGEAAVLWGAGSPQQAASGEVSGLQVQAATQTHLPRGRQEAAHRRVQGHYEVPQTGNETVLQCGVRELMGKCFSSSVEFSIQYLYFYNHKVSFLFFVLKWSTYHIKNN